MIKTVSTGQSQYLRVFTSTPNYVSAHNAGQAGAMRFNMNGQYLEVYDGYSWQNVTSQTDIALTEETIDILNWAREQKNKQKEMKEWALTHPTLQSALEDLDLAQEKAELVWLLCQEYEKVQSKK